MLDFDLNPIVAQAVSWASTYVSQGIIRSNTMPSIEEAREIHAKSKYVDTEINFGEEKGLEIYFKLLEKERGDDLSFVFKVDYNSSKIPSGVRELYSIPRVFANGLVKNFVELTNCEIKTKGIHSKYKNVKFLCKEVLAVQIEHLANLLLHQKFVINDYEPPRADCILLTGDILVTQYKNYKKRYYFKRRGFPRIYCDDGSAVAWESEEIEIRASFDECYGENMREIKGFVILDKQRGFHLEGEAQYDESRFEPIENMW